LDGLDRLRDSLFPQLNRQIRAHRVGVPARAGRPAEHGIHVNGRLSEPLIVLDSLGHELARARHLELRVLHPSCRQRLAQALHGGFGLNPERGVGLHPHDKVDAALQVEAKVHLHAGRVERPDREDDYGENGQDFPAQILIHD
jgi:hypothetical protein